MNVKLIFSLTEKKALKNACNLFLKYHMNSYSCHNVPFLSDYKNLILWHCGFNTKTMFTICRVLAFFKGNAVLIMEITLFIYFINSGNFYFKFIELKMRTCYGEGEKRWLTYGMCIVLDVLVPSINYCFALNTSSVLIPFTTTSWPPCTFKTIQKILILLLN